MSYQKGDRAYDWSQSDRRFIRLVWPVVSETWEHLRGFRLMTPKEKEACRLAMRLDQDCNIDYIAESPEGKRRVAIASRVQENFERFNTFTVRASRATGAPTELPKMLDAIENGYIYAGRMVHSYVRQWPGGDETLIRTMGMNPAHFCEFYKAHPDLCPIRSVWDGNEFMHVEVDDLVRHGVNVDVIQMPDPVEPDDIADFGRDVEWNPDRYAKGITVQEWLALRQIASFERDTDWATVEAFLKRGNP